MNLTITILASQLLTPLVIRPPNADLLARVGVRFTTTPGLPGPLLREEGCLIAEIIPRKAEAPGK